MAFCGTCGAQSARIRTTFTVDGKPAPPKDECPNCAPHSFERRSDPSDLKFWLGPDVDPAHYKKTDDGWQASDSVLQDLQDWAEKEDDVDDERNERFLKARREYCAAHRTPETPSQKIENDAKAREFIRQMEARDALIANGFFLPETV